MEELPGFGLNGLGKAGETPALLVGVWLQLNRMYSAEVLDHFQNPRNAGEVPNADARVQIENPACGDVLELTAKIANERMVEIRFRAKGCVSAMACSSALTELVAGKTVQEARAVTRDELLEKVGGLPEASAHAAYLAVDALQALLKQV
jgi:nitrogen fixation protein NifU and related proteins